MIIFMAFIIDSLLFVLLLVVSDSDGDIMIIIVIVDDVYSLFVFT